MTIARRIFYAGGALMMAAMLGRCDNPPTSTPDGGTPDQSVPDLSASPTLTMVSPANAVNTGGTMITITGTNFRPGATVTIGNVPATQITVASSTQITCVVPAKATSCGPTEIVVKNLDNSTATDNTLFKYRSGTLGFAAANALTVGTTPRYVITHDVDGDGNLDILTANSGTGNVSILPGQGNGSFGAVNNIDFGGGSPFAVAVADINNDQKLDLVTVHRQANMLKVRLGTGPGTFMMPTTDSWTTGLAPYDLAIGKLNADNNLDAVVANSGSSNNVSVFIGNGTGGFTAGSTSAVTGTAPQAIILAHFNGDQNLDYATANFGGSSNHVTARNGDGLGGFSLTSGSLANITNPTDLVAGDFNSDGKLDIAVANGGVGTMRLGVGDGNGGFIPTTSVAVGTTAVTDRSIAAADVNLDGFLDVVVSNVADGTVSVLLGDGNGGFAPKVDLAVGASPGSVTLGDLNKDGLPDVVSTNQGGTTVTVRLNQCQ